jgi:predicted  nucleic acid-binding Zn-ribbon protein
LQLKEQINNLRELQEVDLEIDRIDAAITTGDEELQAQRAIIEKLQVAIAEYRDKLALGSERRQQLEAEVQEAQALIKDRQNKMMKVQTNREYQSLLKEIEDAKNANRQREEELVRLLEQDEYLQNKDAEQSALLATEEAGLAEQTSRREAETVKLAAKRQKLAKEREVKAKKVKADLLRKYELIRAKRDGLAMAGVNKGVCFGCYMNVPPQLYNELLREDKMHICPTCNRMLYHCPDKE